MGIIKLIPKTSNTPDKKIAVVINIKLNFCPIFKNLSILIKDFIDT